nr:hypothetical protein DA06_12980 [Georgenia sp. SUBG003]
MDDLVARCQDLVAAGSRRILGVTGTPGAGKTTVSAALAAALGDTAVLIGMDGFHYANMELRRLGRAHRKGAPDTFDVDGYVALLSRLSDQGDGVVYAPYFDRALEESIGSAVPVFPDVPLVITEGNYLLNDDHGWGAVRQYLDEAWFIDVAPDVRRERLINRRISYGHSELDSVTWVDGVDERNAAAVEPSRDRADLIVHVTTALG